MLHLTLPHCPCPVPSVASQLLRKFGGEGRSEFNLVFCGNELNFTTRSVVWWRPMSILSKGFWIQRFCFPKPDLENVLQMFLDYSVYCATILTRPIHSFTHITSNISRLHRISETKTIQYEWKLFICSYMHKICIHRTTVDRTLHTQHSQHIDVWIQHEIVSKLNFLTNNFHTTICIALHFHDDDYGSMCCW